MVATMDTEIDINYEMKDVSELVHCIPRGDGTRRKLATGSYVNNQQPTINTH